MAQAMELLPMERGTEATRCSGRLRQSHPPAAQGFPEVMVRGGPRFRHQEEPGQLRSVCSCVSDRLTRTCNRVCHTMRGFANRWGNDQWQPPAQDRTRQLLESETNWPSFRSTSSTSLCDDPDLRTASVGSSSSFSSYPRMPTGSFEDGRRHGEDVLEVRKPPLGPPSLVGAALHVRVLAAYNLKNLDSGRNTDTYVEVRVGGDMRRTSTAQGSLSPTWRESKLFKFRLEQGDSSIAFEAFGSSSTWKSTTSLGLAKANIADWVPGKTVRARLPLRQVPGAGPEQGDIELEVSLLVAGQSLDFLHSFTEGERVQVWSNSQNKWFEDGLVEEVILRSKVINGYKVAAGSVKVRFCDRKSVKYLNAQQARSILRKAERTHDWLDINTNEEVPDRAVRTGRHEHGGDLYVARNKQGEPGKMTLTREPGPRTMNKIWCHQHDKEGAGDILVLRQGCAAVWQQIRKGDMVPQSAVHCKEQNKDGRDVYVARNKQGEAGKLTISGKLGDSFCNLQMMNICCHAAGTVEEGEVLTICEMPRELEIQLLRGEGLTSPENRVGDLGGGIKGANLLKPYVEVECNGSVWQSGFREAPVGNVDFRECLHIPLQADLALEKLQISVRVFDRRLRQRTDPPIGEGCLHLTRDLLGASKQADCVVKIERSGAEQGQLFMRVREILVPTSSLSDVPADGPLGREEITEELIATEVRQDGLPEKIEYCFQREETKLQQTLLLVAEALTSGPGGIIIVVLGNTVDTKEIPFESMDNGLSTELSRSTVGNISDRPELFKVLLASSSTQTEAGRWDARSIEDLSGRLGSPGGSTSSPPNTAELVGRPKGGVWILSARGTILTTAARFIFDCCCPYQLLPGGGQPLTLRHSEAINIAYWMTSKCSNGAVFARWESGDVVTLLPVPPLDLGPGTPKPRDGRPAVFRAAAPFHASRR